VPNSAAVQLIARALPALVHPGDETRKPFAIPLLGLRSAGVPPDMAKSFADQAGLPTSDAPKLIAEAVVHLLETDGNFTIIDTTELQDLRIQAADAPDGIRTVTVHCRCDRPRTDPLLVLTVGKTDQVVLDMAPVIEGLARRSPVCPHEMGT
jgi:hypothetical protein